MTTTETSRKPRLLVYAGALACALVALPFALAVQSDGSVLKMAQAVASGDGGDHDGDHGDSSGHDDHSGHSEHGSSSDHDSHDDSYNDLSGYGGRGDDSRDDQYRNEDRNS